MRITGKSAAEASVLSAVRKSLLTVEKDMPLLVGVSGGADSVAMLHALHSLGRSLKAVNCNFHLRGEESDRDSAFVLRLCAELGVEVEMLDFDTLAYCRDHNVSIEMGCRELRYAEFRRLRRLHGFSRIAVAHNADDNIETLFLNLLRGTGLKGLCGMEPDNGEILRPMLTLSRKEIEVYLNEIGADHVEDSSNTDDDFRRNFLRLRVLPLLESRWPGMRKAVSSTIDNLRGANEICETAVKGIPEGGERDFVSRETLATFPSPRYLLHSCFGPKGATPAILREMEISDRSGAEWRLPEGVVRLQKDGFHYYPTGEGRISSGDFMVEEMRLTASVFEEITTGRGDNSTAWFPGRFNRYEWASLSEGMRFAPMGMRGTRKIADMLRDARIGAVYRTTWPLLRDSETGEVVWIPCVRRSRYAQVGAQDSHVTKISLSPRLRKGRTKGI